jgi:preprotein translocase subunit SecA
MNQQREVVYSLRLFALERGEQLKAEATRMVDQAMGRAVTMALLLAERPEDYDRAGLQSALLQQFLVSADDITDAERTPTSVKILAAAKEAGHAAFGRKIEYLQDFAKQVGVADVASQVLSTVMLTVLDEKWKDHLYDLDQLRNAIQYRAYGQRDPLVEYKKEAFEMFEDLMRDVHATFTERFLKIQVTAEPPRPAAGPPRPAAPERHSGADDLFAPDARVAPPPSPAVGPRLAAPPTVTTNRGPVGPPAGGVPAGVGRNDPCPCGSGKKYKKCHGVGR